MTLSERIALIITENGLKQKELAEKIGVTESYISALLRGKRQINPSQSFANLIEEKLGYSSQWVLTGEGKKFKNVSRNSDISDEHKKAIMHVEKMNNCQIKAVLAFIDSLDKIESSFTEPENKNSM